MKDKIVKFLTIIGIVVIIGLIIVLNYKKKDQREEPIKRYENIDYGKKSKCDTKYYAKSFLLIDNELYAILDSEIVDIHKLRNQIEKKDNEIRYFIGSDIGNFFYIENGNCNKQYFFIQDNLGHVYYVNNFADSKRKALETVLVKEYYAIDHIEKKESETIGWDSEGNSFSFNKLINQYSKLES